MGHFSHKQNFLGGVAVLTMAVVVVKLISAVYKIPLGNLLDDEGMGHFNIAYNVYNFRLQLSTAGFPLALSKMTSEAMAPVPCGGSPVFCAGCGGFRRHVLLRRPSGGADERLPGLLSH